MRDTLLHYLFRIFRARRPRTQSEGEANTILVLQYHVPLDCCVHGTPLYAAIKRVNPAATIIVASSGTGFATLKHDPHIDHLIETPDPMRSLVSLWTTARMLRKGLLARNLQPDLILQDASNQRGRYALFALLVGVAPMVGFANAAPLYDRHFAYDPKLSLIDNNLRMLEAVDGPRYHLEPALYFSADELARVRDLLSEINPTGLPLVAFVMQGSGGQATGWHDERFAEVIEHVHCLGHLPLFGLGTATEVAVIDRIQKLAGGVGVSLAGRTSIRELAALLCLCDLVVSVDAGIMHVGRAVDVPMVVLGPSWQEPLKWLPLDKDNVRILRGLDRADVPAGYRLDEIEFGDVITAVDDLLRSFPPSVESRERRVSQRLSTRQA
jgi:ADP-heptose:LPS heptosyltransferase